MQLRRLLLDRGSLRLQQLVLGDVIPLVNLGIVVSQFTWESEERRFRYLDIDAISTSRDYALPSKLNRLPFLRDFFFHEKVNIC